MLNPAFLGEAGAFLAVAGGIGLRSLFRIRELHGVIRGQHELMEQEAERLDRERNDWRSLIDKARRGDA